jgi:capsular polysaccharide biosynthesis protein
MLENKVIDLRFLNFNINNSMILNVLENRENFIFMHWFLFVISGLCDLIHDKNLERPILFHTNVTEDFQRETFELLKPDFEYIENVENYTIINRHGAPLVGRCHVLDHYYHFVRDSILVKNNLEVTTPFRRIYISRSKSHLLLCNQGLKRRQMINESALMERLTQEGFECIYLEDYNLRDKIKLFQESKIVVSPNGGAFTMCFFANKASTMVFIRNPGTTETQYSHICEVLSIPIVYYEKVRCKNENGNDTRGEFLENFNMELTDQDDLIHTIQPYL